MDHAIIVFKEGTKSILCITNGEALYSISLFKQFTEVLFSHRISRCMPNAWGKRTYSIYTNLVGYSNFDSRPPDAVKHFALGVR